VGEVADEPLEPESRGALLLGSGFDGGALLDREEDDNDVAFGGLGLDSHSLLLSQLSLVLSHPVLLDEGESSCTFESINIINTSFTGRSSLLKNDPSSITLRWDFQQMQNALSSYPVYTIQP